MAGLDLPAGLRGAYLTLANHDRSGNESFDRLSSLVWLRLLTDKTAPLIAGWDPRASTEFMPPWLAPWTAELLDGVCGRMNEVLGCGDLLSTDWHELPTPTLNKVVEEMRRWAPAPEWAPDYIGEISQRVRTSAAKSNRGEFYTPYSLSLMMARMTGVEAGARVLDPCCGSGRMLLAALEVNRDLHPEGPLCEVYGVDISPAAVRMCQLNLALAGIAPAFRVECMDFLLAIPFEEASPLQQAMQLELYRYEAGELVGWRQRDVA